MIPSSRKAVGERRGIPPKSPSGVDDELVPKLSYKFKDKNIKLSIDRLSATGYKVPRSRDSAQGWSSVFSTHCSSSGKW